MLGDDPRHLALRAGRDFFEPVLSEEAQPHDENAQSVHGSSQRNGRDPPAIDHLPSTPDTRIQTSDVKRRAQSQRSQNAPVHVNDLPVDEIGGPGGQEHSRPDQLGGIRPTAGRGAGAHPGVELLVFD